MKSSFMKLNHVSTFSGKGHSLIIIVISFRIMVWMREIGTSRSLKGCAERS